MTYVSDDKPFHVWLSGAPEWEVGVSSAELGHCVTQGPPGAKEATQGCLLLVFNNPPPTHTLSPLQMNDATERKNQRGEGWG